MKTLGGLFAFFTLAVLVVAAGFGALRWTYLQPGPLQEAVVVEIPRGIGPTSIADRLAAAGVIDDTTFYLLNIRLDQTSGDLKAGEFEFPAGVSPSEVTEILRSGRSVTYSVTIPEGLTSREIVQILRDNPVLTGEVTEVPPQGSVLPETYAVLRGDDRQSVLDRMQSALDDVVAELWEDRAEGLPIATPEEAVVLASIVEKETGVDGERGMVASVFINRLNIGMKLQSDPTTIFAMTMGERDLGRELLRSDWAFESEYNTYHAEGLPPGPIAHPGEAAIAAVLNPASTPYIFFVADGTGGHAFAETLDEHNRNVRAWQALRAQ